MRLIPQCGVPTEVYDGLVGLLGHVSPAQLHAGLRQVGVVCHDLRVRPSAWVAAWEGEERENLGQVSLPKTLSIAMENQSDQRGDLDTRFGAAPRS